MRIRTVKRAFTLIEILIVVVILGILAAIVIPQFTDASQDAMDANVRSQLQTIRSQIELFNVQAPANAMETYDTGMARVLGDFWVDLVALDYLQQAPRNPLCDALTNTSVGVGPALGVAWVWDDATADFTAVAADGTAFVE